MITRSNTAGIRSPEELAYLEEMAQALMFGRDKKPSNAGQGFASLAEGITAGLMLRGARKGREAGMTERSALSDRIMNAIRGGAAPSIQGQGSFSQNATPLDAGGGARQARSASSRQFSGSQQEFVDMLMPAAMEASQRTGIDPRIIVAQAAQETGWGRSAPGNNFFGIKSHGKGGGQTFNTHEYVNGKRVNISDSFRQFGSPEESVAGYADFILENPRYRKLMGAQGLDAQLEALQASGYATDPNYSRSVGSIARGIQIPDAQQALENLSVGQSMPMSGPGVQVAQAGGGLPTGGGGDLGTDEIMSLLSNPWLDPGMKTVLSGMLQQQMQSRDPMRQLQMQKLQRELSQGQPLINAGDGRLYDPNSRDWITAPDAGAKDPTSAMQNYQFLLEQGVDPETAMSRAFSGGTTVNVGGAEKGFDKTVGEGYGNVFLEMRNEQQSARRALDALDVMEQSLSQPGFYSGAGGEQIQQLKRMGAALGMDPEGISSIETFNAMSKQAALDAMGGSLGSGFSNADRDFVIEQVPNLGNTVEGNRQLIGIQRKLNQRKMDMAQLARDYAEDNDGRIDAGFDQFLSEWADQNPLFPRRVSSEEDFMNLPSGAEFIAPDGSIRRKP